MKDIVIIGAGGYSQEIVWVADAINAAEMQWNILGYVDPAKPHRKGEMLYDRPILGGWEEFRPGRETFFCCGIGDPAARRKECDEAELRGFKPATLIHPSAILAKHVTIGEGCVLGPLVVMAPYSSLGRHAALNTGSVVGHNSEVGDFAVLCPYAQVLGGVTVGPLAYLSTHSTVNVRRKVGAGAVLGANSFLLTDLPARASAIGIPAKVFAKLPPEAAIAASTL
jgi:sugar O-acyltransferase (sialic acid O-acetyltransferase NeuD family)